MRANRSGSTRAGTVLYEEWDLPQGNAVEASLSRGSMFQPTGTVGTQFYGSSGGGGAPSHVLANGLATRRITSAIATGGVFATNKNFPLRARWNAAPVVPVAYRSYRRFTFECIAWRNQLTAVVAMEVGLTGNGTSLPGEAFNDPKYVFRSLLAENAGDWQTSHRLVDGGAPTKVTTGVSPLVPAKMRWVFDEGPIPQLRMYLNDVLRLTAQDGTAIVLPTAIIAGTVADASFGPALGMEGAVGDFGYVRDSYYRVEKLN